MKTITIRGVGEVDLVDRNEPITLEKIREYRKGRWTSASEEELLIGRGFLPPTKWWDTCQLEAVPSPNHSRLLLWPSKAEPESNEYGEVCP